MPTQLPPEDRVCPHCGTSVTVNLTEERLSAGKRDGRLLWRCVRWFHCTSPSCKEFSVFYGEYSLPEGVPVGQHAIAEGSEVLIYPKAKLRKPVPSEVPEGLATDFVEACLVLAESPKASAALSRRCLQHLLREHLGIQKRDLDKEIGELLGRKELPSAIAGSVDAIRTLGNFAAHPIKSTNTGELVDVEPGEAEWTLDVLEALFDVYFIQPKRLDVKRQNLNKKLAEAGKPPLKS